MAYIYLIENKINHHKYVGKTNETVYKRFRRHVNSSININDKDANSPLHKAIRKYGEDNFIVSTIEECSSEQASEREIYWIKYYETYLYGYNATQGGDGSTLYDYSQIVDLYNRIRCVKDVADKLKCDTGTIRRALREYHIQSDSDGEVSKRRNGKQVAQTDLETGTILRIYLSQMDAAKAMIEQGYCFANINNRQSVQGIAGRIGQVARGKRKQTFGFGWKYV